MHSKAGQVKYPTLYRDARLDHFNANDFRTFKQRWWINEDHFVPPSEGGPAIAILYINGEGPASGPPSAPGDFSVQLAQRYGALIATVEHRYYGYSNPCQTLPEFCVQDSRHLSYLSVEQHMEDLVDVIEALNQKYASTAPLKWICVGGSYSGATSAWFRSKYPHVVSAAHASSAVVNAIYNFSAWDGQVSTSVGPACAARLTTLLGQIEAQFAQSAQTVCEMFDAADTCEIPGDFFRALGDVYGESVQYGYQQDLCNVVMGASDSQLLPQFVNYTLNFWVPIFGALNQYATSDQSNVTWSSGVAFNYRLWWWQKATEFAWFQTASQPTPMRSSLVNLAYAERHVIDLFGDIISGPQVIDHTNMVYGGNTTIGTRIFFVDGSQDPWKHASISHALDASRPYLEVTCTNCGHCVDLHGTCPGGCSPNPNVVTEARQTIFAQFDIWVTEILNEA